jgi:deazaflavin-dependent oxidoreductase (nitroreductase family)
MADWNANIIEEFRSNEGRVGGHFEGATLVLLTHRGAKSGTERTNPLMYREEGGRIFVFASKGGHTAHPHWYLNVMANPDVTVEIGDRSFRARAVEITGDERDEIFARQAKDWPAFGEYQRENPRTIPVVELVEVR